MKNHLRFQLARPSRGWVTALLILGLFVPPPAYGQWVEVQQLTPVDVSPDDEFGHSVAVSAAGSVAVIGAPFHDLGDTLGRGVVGQVYILEKQGDGTWETVQTLRPPVPWVTRYFGSSVAVSADGGVIVIGAPYLLGTAPTPDRVFIYERENKGPWVLKAALKGPHLPEYGMEVAVSAAGDWIVIGSANEDDLVGAAYILRRGPQDWSTYETTRLTPSDGATLAFGSDVALNDDFVFIGAPFDDERGDAMGAVFIFRIRPDGGVEEVQKVTVPGTGERVQFGHGIALSENLALIGSPFDHEKGRNAGAAYVLELRDNDTWVLVQKLTAWDGSPFDFLGSGGLAIAEGIAIVGAPGDDNGINTEEGSAYVFLRQAGGTWQEVQKLSPSDGERLGEFGNAIGLSASGNIVFIGSSRSSPHGDDSGAVYLFVRPVIERFVLVTADREVVDADLADVDTIDLNQLGNIPFNIQVLTDPASVGSVKLELSGPRKVVRTENVAPYEVFGNGSERLRPGEYTLKATPYPGFHARGRAGVPLTIRFTVTLEPTVVRLRLVNAAREVLIDSLTNGSVIHLPDYPAGTTFNIQAVTEPPQVGSVRFQLSGPLRVTHIENHPPFEVFGNGSRALLTGSYQLSARAFELAGAKGAAGAIEQLEFRVTGAPALALGAAPNTVRAAEAPGLQLRVYPNPMLGQATLELEGLATGNVHTRLIDLTGKVLREWKTEKESTSLILPLDLSGLPAGGYEIQTIVGAARARVRVVKGR